MFGACSLDPGLRTHELCLTGNRINIGPPIPPYVLFYKVRDSFPGSLIGIQVCPARRVVLTLSQVLPLIRLLRSPGEHRGSSHNVLETHKSVAVERVVRRTTILLHGETSQ